MKGDQQNADSRNPDSRPRRHSCAWNHFAVCLRKETTMSEHHSHYFPEDLDPKILAEAKAGHLHGPMFVGQGWCKSVGSDTYGGYVVSIDITHDRKPLIGLVSAHSEMAGHWTEGSMNCSMPESRDPDVYITVRGKWPDGSPKWWFCNKYGVRSNEKCRYSWNGAYAYRDPSF